MLKSKDFWVGIALGFLLYYVYSTKLKGMGGGSKG